MSEKPRTFDPERYVDEASAMIGLPIDPAHKPGVVDNIATLHRMARLVMDFPLADDAEAGPVFRP